MPTRYEAFTAVISAIHRCVQKIERDEMIRCGYKGAFAQYLTAMTHYPQGVTAAQLCEVCDRDKAAVSRALSEMEEKQLICRVTASDHSYRALLTLTDTGRAAADFVFQRGQSAVTTVGRDLSDTERAVFYTALNKIANNLEEVCLDGLPPFLKEVPTHE